MKTKALIVMGKLDPKAMKDPRVARFHSKEFREEFIEGMREAKELALKQPNPVSRRVSSKAKAA